MRESRMYGSGRGALSNERPYRDRQAKLVRSSRCKHTGQNSLYGLGM